MTAKQRLEMLVEMLDDQDPVLDTLILVAERRMTQLADGAQDTAATSAPRRMVKTGTFRAA